MKRLLCESKDLHRLVRVGGQFQGVLRGVPNYVGKTPNGTPASSE